MKSMINYTKFIIMVVICYVLVSFVSLHPAFSAHVHFVRHGTAGQSHKLAQSQLIQVHKN